MELDTIRHVEEVLQLMAVMTEDTGVTFLDRLEARSIAKGEARGLVRGTILTCRDFGMDEAGIFEKIT